MSKGFLDTPIGILEITAKSGKIVRIDLLCGNNDCVEDCRNRVNVEEYMTEQDKSAIENAKTQLTEYFDGSRQEFNLDIELNGTDFQKAVWNVLLTIPYGQTMSYAEAAQAAGHPKAQRAAGSAIGKNPLLIVVPCHRVIKSDGSIGGFGAGIENKIILHKIEGI